MDKAQLERLVELLSKYPPQVYIQKLIERGEKLTPAEACIMTHVFKKFGKDDCYDTDDMDLWRDDVLKGYIKHIKNYKYHYKPEAQELDPRCDPETEHIGPMAQDIEKVNPAAVHEDQGYKSVDIGRLALMNAGAIAELAREVQKLGGANGGEKTEAR